MARTPAAGACKTRLIPSLGPAGAAALYQCMLADTLAHLSGVASARHVLFYAGDTAPEAPHPWEHARQVGAALGARLEHVLSTTPPGPVLIVGSDMPHIQSAWLEQVPEPGEVLLGPSADGGYYAIGMGAALPEAFRDVPWSTARVFEITQHRLAALGQRVTLLPLGFDIDEPEDVQTLGALLEQDPARAPLTAHWLRRHAARPTPPAGPG